MLNNKKNNFTKQNSVPAKASFVQYPQLSRDSFIQTGLSPQAKLGINTVFNQNKIRTKTLVSSNRFEYNKTF